MAGELNGGGGGKCITTDFFRFRRLSERERAVRVRVFLLFSWPIGFGARHVRSVWRVVNEHLWLACWMDGMDGWAET